MTGTLNLLVENGMGLLLTNDVADVVFKGFLETGLGWAILGAIFAVGLGCAGSARGIGIAAMQSAGAMSEKPEIFGKLLVLVALPGTQGFYGFICAIIIAQRCGIIDGNLEMVGLHLGISICAVGLGVGYVLLKSATFQGQTSAACINLVAKLPGESGRAILLPALVETYAVVALLAGIIMTIWLTQGIQAQ